jgi:hypothetical protein
LDAILIKSHRIDAFGKKAAALGIDQPENPIALTDVKVSARRKHALGNATPSGLRHVSPRHLEQETASQFCAKPDEMF